MEQYQLETKIREIVLELSTPSIQRVTQCLQQIKQCEQRMEFLSQQIVMQNQVISNGNYQMAGKFNELDILTQMARRVESDLGKQGQLFTQQIGQLKNSSDKMKLELTQQNTHLEIMSSLQIKLQTELQQLSKRQVEASEENQAKIDDFFKEQYTFYVESRNIISKVNKDFHYQGKELENHKQAIDKLMLEMQSLKQENKQIANRVDATQSELQDFVQKDIFQQMLDKNERLFIQELQAVKQRLRNDSDLTSVNISSLQEKITGLENFEISYREQLNQCQQDMNQFKQEFQLQYNKQQSNLELFSKKVTTMDRSLKEAKDTFQNQVQSQISAIQSNNKKEIIKVQQQIEDYLTNSMKKLNSDIQWKLEETKMGIQNDIISKCQQLIDEIPKVQQTTIIENRTVEVQTSDAYVPDIKDFIKSSITEAMSTIQVQKKTSVEQVTDTILREPAMHFDIQDQLDDLKADLSILNELRQEQDQKLRVFTQEFNDAMLKVEKSSNITLKLKSDSFNDNEYLNQQLRSAFRQIDVLNKKILLLTSLASGNSESCMILATNLLQNCGETMKFTSKIEGTVVDLRGDSCLYRNGQYSQEDLLKKIIISQLDIWTQYADRSELTETNTHYPLNFYNQFILRYTRNKRDSKSMDKPLKQSPIEDKKTKLHSQQNSISISYEKREKTMTVKRMLRSTVNNSREMSPEPLPKVGMIYNKIN